MTLIGHHFSRSDHLYVFFIQWSPDVFGDGLGSISRDPGFIVVKKIEESEANEEQQPEENSEKEWEVRPMQLTCLQYTFYPCVCILCVDMHCNWHALYSDCFSYYCICTCLCAFIVWFYVPGLWKCLLLCSPALHTPVTIYVARSPS